MATKDQLIASAQKNLEKGQIHKAIKDYQELLKLEPKVDQHKQKLADLLCRVNLKADAFSLYDSLAKGYAERGFFAKAVAVYKQMQRIDTANTDIYLRLAELNCSLGLIGNAMAEYRTLLEFYEKRNLVAETAVVLQKMVELEPDNINLQLRVLQYLLKEKLFDKVKGALLHACEVCRKSADSSKSQKILQAVLPNLPGNNELQLEIAEELSRVGLLSDAIFVFQYLLKKSPQNPAFIQELVRLYNQLGDTENEALNLVELLLVEPTSASAERLVRLCMEMGDHERALRELEAHEALLDDESHTLLVELYQELEIHLPGDPRVRSAIVRHFGGTPAPASKEEAPEPSPLGELSLGDTSGDFSFGGDEFQLPELLSPQGHPDESPASPVEIELPEEEFADVLIELPESDLSLGGEVAGDLEEIDGLDELSAAEPVEGETKQDLIDIDIDFDFSEGEESEPEAAAEIEVAIDQTDADLEELSPPFDLNEGVEPLQGSAPLDFGTMEAPLEMELSPEESSIPVVVIEPIPEAEMEAPEEIEISVGESQIPEEIIAPIAAAEIASEEEEEEDILELEPLEEEEGEEEEDLAADLAALEALLETEMEEAPVAAELDLAPPVAALEPAAPPAEDDFFDLAAELLDEGAMQATEGLANVGEIDRFRFDSVFSEFKKGVDAQIDLDDTEAHYDLGIAYKEMGLMDDAIEEFKKSMRHPKRLADSLILIGICHAEKGAFADAETIFLAAMARPELQSADRIGMQYELGLVYEIWGRPADALHAFEAVAQSDPAFRNVGEKIESLRLHVAAAPSHDSPTAASPGKDRISFV